MLRFSSVQNSLGLRLIQVGVFLAFGIFPLFAGSEAVPKTNLPTVVVSPAPSHLPVAIDGFESGDIKKWYVFDKITPRVVPAPTGNVSFGKHVLKVTGATEAWYVGGMGFYLGKDVSGTNALQVYIWGNGPNSGKVKFEITDDDNGNYEKEQDTKFNLLHDDNWSYELTVNWSGWKRILIPFKRFADTNPGVGNDTWDPNAENGSGGLLTFQMIFLAPKQSGEISMAFDQIQLINLAN